jgi:hypothetical protein
MPEVPGAPYEPTFTGQVTERPAPEPGVEAVPAAFGAATAQALREFGGDVETGAGKVFNSAMAFKRIQIEADARKQVAAFNQEFAPLQADFDSLQEDAARTQLQSHLQTVEALRVKYRQGLPLIGQQMYDQELASIQNYAVRASANHATSEYKKFITNNAQADIDLAKKSFVNPNDPVEFQHKVDNITNATLTWKTNENKSDKEYEDKLFNELSGLRRSQLYAIAQKHPQDALTLLDDYRKGKLLSQDDQEKAQEYLEGRYRVVMGDDISEKYANQKGSIEDRANAMKAEIAKGPGADIPGYETHAINSLKSKVGSNNWIQTQQDHNYEQTIHNAIQLGPKDQAELEKDPNVATAVAALNRTPDGAKFVQSIPLQIVGFNRARLFEQNDENYRHLIGLSSGSPADKEKFLQETRDMSVWQLDRGGWSKIVAARERILKNPLEEDPRVERAVKWMNKYHGTELEDLNVDRYREAYKDQYYKYIGTLAIAVDEWANAHDGQPPSAKDVKEEIGPEVIQTRVDESGMFGRIFGTTRGRFDIDIDPNDQNIIAARSNIKKQMEDLGYPDYEVTDREVYNAVQRKYFKDLYAGTGTK